MIKVIYLKNYSLLLVKINYSILSPINNSKTSLSSIILDYSQKYTDTSTINTTKFPLGSITS
jgi:hypothetical protein